MSSTHRAWTAVPAARSNWNTLRFRLVVVYVLLGVTALSGVTSTVAWLTAAPEPPDVGDLLAEGRHIADAAVDDFLAGRPTEVPVAGDTSPTFGVADDERSPVEVGLVVRRLDHQGVRRSGHPDPTVGGVIEEHRYRLVAEDGAAYLLAAVVHIDGGVAALAAHPALLPDPVGDDRDPPDGLTYRGVEGARAGLGGQVPEVVAEWAEALLDDDGEALRRIAGDPRAEATYRGIDGLTLAPVDEPVRVGTAVPHRDGWVVRTRVWVRGDRAQRFTVSLDYDLYVLEADTALPKVAAWGPPGSGPTLEAYTNSSDPTPPASRGE